MEKSEYKVLILPGTMYAHCLPFGRVAHQMAAHPGLKLYCPIQPEQRYTDMFPKSTTWLDIPGLLDRGEEGYGFQSAGREFEVALEKIATNAEGWLDSYGMTVTSVAPYKIQEPFIRMFSWLQSFDVDLIIAEPSHNNTNHLNAICKKKGIPYLQIVCPGRPDSVMKPATLMRLLLTRHRKAMMEAFAGFQIVVKNITTGCGLEPSGQADQSWQLLPGSPALVQCELEDYQLMVGSVLTPTSSEEDSSRTKDALPKGPLRTWLEERQDLPVIYISSGTIVQMSKELLKRIAQALNMPGRWRVLWSLAERDQKYLPAADELPAEVFRIEKFVPQAALLQGGWIACHFSHCGSNSTHETLSSGVPMVCMPFYCDQYEWAASVCSEVGAGITVDKRKASAARIRAAVTRVLDDPSYRKNAQAAAVRMRQHLKSSGSALEVDAMAKGGSAIVSAVAMRLLKSKDPSQTWADLKSSMDIAKFQPPKRSLLKRCCWCSR